MDTPLRLRLRRRYHQHFGSSSAGDCDGSGSGGVERKKKTTIRRNKIKASYFNQDPDMKFIIFTKSRNMK